MSGSEAPRPSPATGPPEGEGSAPVGPPSGAQAILAADVGTVYTKVYLLEDVGGERRLVAVGKAPSAGPDGAPDPWVGLSEALTQALRHAGRDDSQLPSQRLLMTSAGTVPRLAIVAPGPAEARAVAGALEGVPARVLEPLTLDGPAREPEYLLSQLEAQDPDAVVVTGRRQGERDPVGAAVEAISRAFGRQAPLLLLTGDPEFTTRTAAGLEGSPHRVAGEGPGTAVQDLAGTYLRERLAAAWDGLATAGRPAAPPAWDGGQPRSSLEGICDATRLIADRYDVDVLTLDLGAAHALAVACLGQGGQRRLLAVARDDLGLRLGRQTILREAGAEALAAWLPVDVDELALRHDARQGLAVPAGLPESVDDLLLEHAFSREALRLLLEDLARRLAATSGAEGPAGLPPVDLVIGSGGALAGVPRLTQAALILLDAVQPDALTQLALDRATALAVLGLIGQADGPQALGPALERDGLLNLGLCIAPVGTGKEGEPAIKVEVAYGSRSPVTVEVAVGAIEVVPLPIGERASLKLWPARDFDIGLGRGAAATPRAEVEGGAVGIIIDARGRPLALPAAREKRQAKLLQWLQSTAAYPQFSFVNGGGAALAAREGLRPERGGLP
jgi:MutL protein